MHDKGNKIWKHNHRVKPIKPPTIIYADLENLLKKMHICQNNPEKSYTEKQEKWAYTFWLFNIDKLFVWPNKKPTSLLQMWKLYRKVL